VIILASKKSNVPVLEYDPTTVKQRITGYGLADKKAVLKMVRIFLGLKDFKGFDDASDALAIGIVAALDNQPSGS
jgi:crossover junction endodeoxyribonuclease RuvC